jgi:hypothetical protein
MTDPGQILKAALWYREVMGFSVIPVSKKKVCAISKEKGGWDLYKEEKPTVEQIKEWWTGEYKNCNVAIITGEISNLTVVDVDSENGSRVGLDAIEEITPDGMITPTSQSPRGGEHRYFLYGPGTPTRVRFLPDCDSRSEGGYIIAPPSGNGRGDYIWKPGLSIAEIPLIELPAKYQDAITSKGLYNSNSLYARGVVNGDGFYLDHNLTTLTTNDHKIKPHTRDDTLFHIANALVKGKLPISEVKEIIEILAYHGCEEPYPEKDISIKIQSVLNRQARQNQNIMQDVRDWVLTTTGHFLTTNCHNELQLTTRTEKKACNMALLRLVEERIIEKYGEKRGCYRLIERDANAEMKFIAGDIKEFDVRLPLGLNRLCSVFAKNIIVIAGSKSSGKTALLMNIAKMNQDHQDVIYFNSEMGDEEWSGRLKRMGFEKQEDIKFKAYGLHKNFHDMMDGEKKIFIVDFLEIHDNFYEIAKFIRLIHEVLRDGICIIAIQKKRGQILARGSDFSMEKARLYLSLDFLEDQRCSQVTIVDAKSPKIPDSLRGWRRRVKIINGTGLELIDANWKM